MDQVLVLKTPMTSTLAVSQYSKVAQSQVKCPVPSPSPQIRLTAGFTSSDGDACHGGSSPTSHSSQPAERN